MTVNILYAVFRIIAYVVCVFHFFISRSVLPATYNLLKHLSLSYPFSILFLFFSFILCLLLASVWVFCFSLTFFCFGALLPFTIVGYLCALYVSRRLLVAQYNIVPHYICDTQIHFVSHHIQCSEVNSQPQPNIHVYWTLLDCCFVHVMIMNERARDSERCVQMYNV